MSIKRLQCYHDQCAICKSKSELSEIPKKARILALKTSRIFFPARNRLCKEHHFKNQPWKNVISEEMCMYTYTSSQIEEMVDLLRCADSLEALNSFEMPSEDYKSQFGVTCSELDEILSLTPSILTLTKSAAKAKTAIKMYLMRLRTGFPYNKITKYFNCSEPTLKNEIRKARAALRQDFVPAYVGFQNLTREFLKEHNTNQARLLCCNENADALVTVWDFTYIYCVKSGNYAYQRNTFSGNKKRNLVKPMVCVCPDGYIIDVFTAKKATINDAKIMKSIFEEHTEVKNVLLENDVIVVDRGFRDVLEDLKSMKFIVKMPAVGDFSLPNAPLSKSKANQSRLVTKVRWVVEARNGHLKTIWAIFAKKWSSREIAFYLDDDIHIAAALINKFSTQLLADNDSEAVATEMFRMNEQTNEVIATFHSIVQRSNFKRDLKNFIPLENNFPFPTLNEDEMKNIASGSYQLKEAKYYAAEHIKTSADSTFKCYWCPHEILTRKFADIIAQKNIQEPALVLTCLASRFRSKKSYNSLVLADAARTGPESIIAYYCQCKHGLRTVGCCSHIMTTIFYLCQGRHSGNIRPIAPYLDTFFQTSSTVQLEDPSISTVQTAEL